jgi:hypothetical protein
MNKILKPHDLFSLPKSLSRLVVYRIYRISNTYNVFLNLLILAPLKRNSVIDRQLTFSDVHDTAIAIVQYFLLLKVEGKADILLIRLRMIGVRYTVLA